MESVTKVLKWLGEQTEDSVTQSGSLQATLTVDQWEQHYCLGLEAPLPPWLGILKQLLCTVSRSSYSKKWRK